MRPQPRRAVVPRVQGGARLPSRAPRRFPSPDSPRCRVRRRHHSLRRSRPPRPSRSSLLLLSLLRLSLLLLSLLLLSLRLLRRRLCSLLRRPRRCAHLSPLRWSSHPP
ncbi:hypothetical protein AKG07_15295 [Microbacterium sp. CGR1]|nr:hypothetical protein AKG07_15295 [Microbacterium sp. CGR1]